MSRTRSMVTDWNQACFADLAIRGLQEVTFHPKSLQCL